MDYSVFRDLQLHAKTQILQRQVQRLQERIEVLEYGMFALRKIQPDIAAIVETVMSEIEKKMRGSVPEITKLCKRDGCVNKVYSSRALYCLLHKPKK